MNITVEGPDNAGKSTLIKFIESHFKRSVVHNTVDKDSSSVLAKQAKELSLEGNLIYDRSAVISEYIYCMVLGRAPVVDFNIHHVGELCDNTVVIFCLPPLERVLSTTKEEMPGVVENLHKLYTAYDNMIDELVCQGKSFFVYNFEIDTEEDVQQYIDERMLKEWKK